VIKLLNGADLAGYIKQRHADQVRKLLNKKVIPKLAIVQVKDDPVIDTYVRLKKQYGADIGVVVDVHKPSQLKLPELLNKLSIDESVHGIIVQLPLPDAKKTDEIVNLVSPDKDVDGLGFNSKFDEATPMAIMWLLAGYNINLAGKRILLIGRGKLVGAPLEKLLKTAGHEVLVAGRGDNLEAMAQESDVIITATSSPGVLTSQMIKPGTVVVDAGVAGEEGKTVGDVASDVYERDDITITPQKGGVGPLTVCALFENVIRAASNVKS
jgi:methylenetetrahydrofolate dehydrogenase (NADP+) / methenyltetrahydrofolate cyclohydrolase